MYRCTLYTSKYICVERDDVHTRTLVTQHAVVGGAGGALEAGVREQEEVIVAALRRRGDTGL